MHMPENGVKSWIIMLFGWDKGAKDPLPANIYFFKVNNRNTRKSWEVCSELTIRKQKDVIDVIVVFLLLILNMFYIFF